MVLIADKIREFMRLEAAGGILLLAATVSAMIFANTPLQSIYDALLEIPVAIRIGALEVAKPLLLWINDGLMAIFFFTVGLELKREILEGDLSRPSQITLPAFAAVGGMLVPALIYAGLNWDDPVALKGWAIPAATDIAFALGVLSVFGERVPTSLKVFLLSLAIIDDLGAILIIAVFYSADISLSALAVALAGLGVLVVFNVAGVRKTAGYLLVGIVVWVSVLKSGVHATLAGVALAFTIPLRGGREGEPSPLCELERNLHPAVAFGILPLFAFANAGISFEGLSLSSVLEPVPLGIAAGLLIGKFVGVLGFSWLAIRLRLAVLPDSVDWKAMVGVAFLCGIGFTMSLFIASLAFEHAGPQYAMVDRLGIVVGSLLSAVAGFLMLRLSLDGAGPAAGAARRGA